jgi:hypothetical protein
MTYWIKRIARLAGILTFFTVFVAGIDPSDPLNAHTALVAAAKGCAGAFLFWLLAFVIADIVVKGLVTDVRTEENDEAQGGLMQRLRDIQSSALSAPSLDGSAGGKPPEKRELAKSAKTTS